MATKSLKILVRITFVDETVERFHDGAGPFMDADGEIWNGVVLGDGLDEIESALNGEAATLVLAISGLPGEASGLAFSEIDNVIGGKVELLIQPLDDADQPDGDPDSKFTGTIDNMPFSDTASDTGVVSSISIEVVNRFTLRRVTSGAVLSDVDQQARAALLNPTGNPDRFAERIPGLADKTIRWPGYS